MLHRTICCTAQNLRDDSNELRPNVAERREPERLQRAIHGLFVKMAELTTATQQKVVSSWLLRKPTSLLSAKLLRHLRKEAADVYALREDQDADRGADGCSLRSWEMQSETSEKLAAIWAVPAPKAHAAKAKAQARPCLSRNL